MANNLSDYWTAPKKDYQVSLKVIDEPQEPVIDFPLVLQPAKKEESLQNLLKEISEIAAKPSDKGGRSTLRQLLDSNGGAIHIKHLPLKSAQDFSTLLDGLAGTGEKAWKPHVHVGMEVLRRPQAKNVLTANEGPPSHFIGWHNEYAVSPVHPAYLILFCLTPPGSGGETSVCNSIALYDRLQKEVPGFVEGCADKGLVYQIPHTLSQVGGIVGGNGLYKESAFGPKNGAPVPETEEGKRTLVESRILELAHAGGWYEGIDKSDKTKPEWQRRGFDWTWQDNGDLEVVHRVAGVRVHPTQNKKAIFNAMSTRYTNASVHNTWDAAPTFEYTNSDGSKGVAIPPHFAGVEKDTVIPRQWLEKMDEWQHKIESSITWDQGDILIVDNFAAQHARWGWEGERKIQASFWDENGLVAHPPAVSA
ncbi:hypothetical protein DV738_g4727, partial [Chaetothyriales sp. CBS 135597]